MFIDSGSSLSFCLSYMEGLTIMTGYFIHHSIVWHRIQAVFVIFYETVKRIRNGKGYIEYVFVSQGYEAFRDRTNVRYDEKFFFCC